MKKTIKYLQDGEYHYATVKDVGDLEQLRTKHKEDLVTALNELFTTGGNAKPTGYDDLVKKVNDTQTSLNGINSKVDNANNKINDITSNGGGRNLLRNSTNNGNGFKPNFSKIDNWISYATSTVYMEQGQQYTVHADASDGLVWSGTHDNSKESNNVVLWLVDGRSVNQIISDSNTGTGTTFIWNHPSGTYYLRVNTYKADNSGYVKRVMLEKGTIAHDWQPNPEDTDNRIDNVNTKIDQTINGINNTITDINGKVVANDEAITQAKKDLQDALTQFQTFNDEIDQAKKDAETELANAKQSLKDEFNTNLANAQKANQKQLEDRIATIQGNLDTTSNTLNDVKTQLTNAKLDYGAVNTSIQKLNDTLSTKLTSTDLDPLKTSIQQQETEIQQAKDSIATKAGKAELDVLSGRVSTAESKIKQQADEISLGVKKSELNGAIDNYQIEGTNRLRNTLDFDIDGGYWKLDRYSIKSTADVHPYDQAHDVSALVLQKTGSAKQDVDFTNEDLGQSFVVSMWNKKDAQPQVWYGNTQLTNRQVAEIKGDYERSFFTFIPTNVNVKTIMFKYDAGTVDQLVIGEPKLELGTKPKVYAPNPNDEHNQIVDTKAELKIASDKIESTIEKQTKTDNNVNQLSSRVTQTEQGITAANDLITKTKDGLIKDYTGKINASAKSLSSEFDEKTNEKIGQITDSGENLILNSAFTNEADRKDKWQNISDKVNIVADNNGLMWAHMSQTGLTADNPISLTSNYFPIKQGKITVGVDIKSDNTSGLSGAKILVLQTYNANKQRVDFTELSLENMGLTIQQLADGESHRGVYRLGNDRSDAVYMTVKAVLPRNGSIYFTNFSAKLSSIDNGGYTPNADDLKRQILNQKTKIEQNSQQISLKASSTELSDVRTIANGAVSSANSANNRLNNLNTGSRNYIQNSESITMYPNGTDNYDLVWYVYNDAFASNTYCHGNNKTRFSFYLKPSKALSTARTFGIYWRASPYVSFGTITVPANTTDTQYYELSITTPTSQPIASQIFIRFMAQDTSDISYTITKSMLTIGDSFPDWQPAPEDVDARIGNVPTSTNIYSNSPSNWYNGTLSENQPTGVGWKSTFLTGYTNRIRPGNNGYDVTPATGTITISWADSWKIFLLEYDSNKNYIGKQANSVWHTTSPYTVKLTNNTRYIALALAKTDDSNISPNDLIDSNRNPIVKLKVEQGSTATPFSWCAQDIQSQIDQARTDIQSTLTVANNGITAATNLKTTYDNYVQKNDANIKLLGDRITNEVSKITSNGGGRNLWIGSKTFEHTIINAPTVEWNTDTNGIRTAHITGTGGFYGQWQHIYVNSTDPFAIGDSETFSVEMKGTGIITIGREHDFEKAVTLTDTWTRYSVSGEVEDTNRAHIMYNKSGKDCDAYVRLPMVEKGTVAHDWQPAPEDTQSQIESVSSKIDQTATSITSTVNSTKQDLQGQINSANTKITQTADSITEQLKSYSKTGDMQNYVNTTVQKTADGINAKVSGMETSLANANSKLDGITSNGGGRNLLRISSFKGDAKTFASDFPTYWHCGSNTTWTFSKETPIASVDSQSLQFTPKSNLWDIANGIWYANLQVKAREVYTFGFWGKSTSNGFRMVVESASDSSTFTMTTAWKYYSGQFKFSTDNRNMYFHANGANVGTVTIFHPMLEKGTIAHDWQPAPEDTDSAIETAKTDLVQQITDAKNAAIKVSKDSINSEVSDVRTTITQVNNKVDNLQIGGQNLLKDTDKMTNTNYWGLRGGQSCRAMYGNKRANETGVALSDYNVKCNDNAPYIDYIPQVSFEQGTDYTVSFWMVPVDAPILYLNANDNANHQHNNSQQNISLQANGRVYNGWHQVTVTFKPKVATAYLTFKVSTAWVSSFKLEKGSKATDWSPAPEDMQTQIDANKTSANNAQNTANTANSNASNAVNTANTANTNANSALTKANSATTVANQANTTASNANHNASNAVSVANSAKSNANQAVNTANSANNKVTAIQANGGGRNLLVGSDPTLSNRPRLGGVTEANIDGVKAWKSTNSSNIYFNVSLEANTTYTYSALIKADTAGGLGILCYGHFQVRNPNAHNQADPTHEDVAEKRDYHGINVPANQWTRIYYTFTTNDLSGSTFGVYPSYVGGHDGHTVYARHLMLEKGTIAHDWSPAPEDVATDISNVNTKVEQYKTGINQTATGINLFAQVITGNKSIDVTKSNIGIDPNQIKIASNRIVIDGDTEFRGNSKWLDGKYINIEKLNYTASNTDYVDSVAFDSGGIIFSEYTRPTGTKTAPSSSNSKLGAVINVDYYQNKKVPGLSIVGNDVGMSAEPMGTTADPSSPVSHLLLRQGNFTLDAAQASGRGTIVGISGDITTGNLILDGNVELSSQNMTVQQGTAITVKATPATQDKLMVVAQKNSNSTQDDYAQPTLRAGQSLNNLGDSGLTFYWNSVKAFGTFDLRDTHVLGNRNTHFSVETTFDTDGEANMCFTWTSRSDLWNNDKLPMLARADWWTSQWGSCGLGFANGRLFYFNNDGHTYKQLN